MDQQAERDLAIEARRGGRAFLISRHDVAYPAGGPFPLVGTTEGRAADRDRAHGTYTTSSGRVIDKATVDQWAQESARAGWASRVWPSGRLITPESVGGHQSGR